MPEVDRLEAYRQAGVDLDLSNAASQIATDWAQTTWGNRADMFGQPVSFDSDFSSSKRALGDEIRNRPGVDFVFGVDGTGTKPELYELMGSFKGLGKDLVAMAIDDIPLEGGQAVLLNNGLVVSGLGTPENDYLGYVDELFEGLAEGANEGGIVLFTGEIAIHGDRLNGPTDFTVDWLADAVGLVHQDRVITGENVKVGDELWAFAEPEGFRCNGISAARKAFKAEYNEDWHTVPFEGSTLGEHAIAPSTIYSGLMNALTGGYRKEIIPQVDIHGAAHISGGSIPEKVGRMLRASGHGADILSPFKLPAIMRHAQEVTQVENPDGSKRPMSDEEMITTWHGGQGYIVAIEGSEGVTLEQLANEHDIVAKHVGTVSASPGIRVTSMGVQTPGKIMEF